MAGENAAIWEVQSGANDGTESIATSTHTQLFNPDSKIISEGAYITNIEVDFRRATPENEAVDADNNEIQDMGIQGFDITITGISGDTNNDTASNLVTKFQKWLKDGNTTTGYTKGRFGLRLENAPQWSVVPDDTPGTFGYHIRNIQFRYLGEKVDQVEFTINMSLGGDITSAF